MHLNCVFFAPLLLIVAMLPVSVTSSAEIKLAAQSSSGLPVEYFVLLPALPQAWHADSVKSLRARGGFQVDLAWNNSARTTATVSSVDNTACTGQTGCQLTLKPGELIALDIQLR